MKISKFHVFLGAMVLQVIIVLKDRQVLDQFDKEFNGLYCYNHLVEEKVAMLFIVGLVFFFTKSEKIGRWLRYYIIGIIILQFLQMTQVPIGFTPIIDYPLMIITPIAIIYLLYLSGVYLFKRVNFQNDKN